MKVTKKMRLVADSHLVIPQEELNKIDGNKRRRISVVITDPRSRHVVLTRYPENMAKVWYQTTIERGSDFIPSAILKKAKIHEDKEFDINATLNGNLIVRRRR